jgi:D-alanyl-D-alanine carboxypeptidase
MAIEATLRAIVERAVGADGPGAILGVRLPTLGIDWQGAAGACARGSDRPLAPTDGFRIASMSKTFTATLVMRLVEAGHLALDARIAEFFPRELVGRLHPDGARITLAHLLNHTAGLWDFAMSEAWHAEVLRDLGRFRSPEEILAWAVAHSRPVGDVGAAYAYSDTGYLLLGHVLQKVTATSYAALCRDHLFDPLGMVHTWLEGHEVGRSTLSHPYFGTLDARAIDGSVDWAAGGHVSTIADLHTFLIALFRDGVLVTPVSLDRMLTSVRTTEGNQYGFGVGIRRHGAPDLPATTRTFWGHGGHWGSWMFYVPEWRGTVIGTVNRAGLDNRWILDAILEGIAAEH